MGGEKSISIRFAQDAAGSPPHGRGKARRTFAGSMELGITPAWAGKRAVLRREPGLPQDHPRVGGEKDRVRFPAFSCKGSPPRRRGKDLGCKVGSRQPGITPAQAGKSEATASTTTSRRDHPRAGGEKGRCSGDGCCRQGSPPRGRGKVVFALADVAIARITPAWAGKSRPSPASEMPTKDHPRIGGEKFGAYAKIWNEWGSPPHGRGKVTVLLLPVPWCGITPAWAGKRFWNRPWVWATSDHPRMGGEKCNWTTPRGATSGSPPHRRGKARHLSHGLLPCG